MEELTNITPREGSLFWSVSIEIQEEDMDTGKIKKVKEEHLVDGISPTEVDKKVHQQMEGTMAEWKILKCVQSKISIVY